jgi:hypothetical protein
MHKKIYDLDGNFAEYAELLERMVSDITGLLAEKYPEFTLLAEAAANAARLAGQAAVFSVLEKHQVPGMEEFAREFKPLMLELIQGHCSMLQGGGEYVRN